MTINKNKSDDRLHLRGLFLDIDNFIVDYDNIKILAPNKILNEYVFASNIGKYFKFKVRSKIAPSSSLVNKGIVDELSDGRFVYPCYGFTLISKNLKGYFVAAPLRELLYQVRPKGVSRYIRCDLKKVCHEQFVGDLNTFARLTRLNLMIGTEKGEKVSSAVLYGTNVVKSNTIQSITTGIYKDYPDNTDSNWSPFKQFKNANDKKILPNSLRITWDKGTGEMFSINTDKHGNFSFYLSEINKFVLQVELFKYLIKLNAMSNDQTQDPLKRSTASIE